jgi:hypothetical protein
MPERCPGSVWTDHLEPRPGVDFVRTAEAKFTIRQLSLDALGVRPQIAANRSRACVRRDPCASTSPPTHQSGSNT